MPLRMHNSLTRAVEPFVPADPSRVTFYTCGPTVYDDAHIGNFRSFLAADVLRRWLASPLCGVVSPGGGVHRGPRRVVQVMNITDVGHMTDDAVADGSGEDKMAAAGRRLAEAKKAGTLPADVNIDPSDPFAVARFYEGRFREDAGRLGLLVAQDAGADPSLMPRATDSVPGMIAVIGRLIERGHAYVGGEEGSRVVYFHVPSFSRYGALSGNTLARLREGAGGRISAANQAGKRHPADFMLWKEDPRHIMKWPSPWGEGYPGWHVECSVMSAARLVRDGPALTPEELAGLSVPDGAPLIDIHSGGEDNIFPHHECEIAQSCCAFNAAPAAAGPEGGMFARLWFHARFLLVEGEKMSKSKGNFFTPRDLFARGVEPAALRLELIKTHYRSNANFTEQGLKDSARMVERWRRVADAAGAADGEDPNGSWTDHPAARAFADAMHEDLNIAGAIGELNKWVSGLDSPTAGDARVLRGLDGVLGVLGLERAAAAETEIGLFTGVEPSPEVEAKLAERAAARAAKDFARADAIREELAQMGYAIKDVAGGKVEVSRG